MSSLVYPNQPGLLFHCSYEVCDLVVKSWTLLCIDSVGQKANNVGIFIVFSLEVKFTIK